MTIQELREINDKKIKELNGTTENVKGKIHEKIKKILANDQIFFNMPMEVGLKVIKCLVDDVEDKELLEIYNSLISPKMFEDQNNEGR